MIFLITFIYANCQKSLTDFFLSPLEEVKKSAIRDSLELMDYSFEKRIEGITIAKEGILLFKEMLPEYLEKMDLKRLNYLRSYLQQFVLAYANSYEPKDESLLNDLYLQIKFIPYENQKNLEGMLKFFNKQKGKSNKPMDFSELEESFNTKNSGLFYLDVIRFMYTLESNTAGPLFKKFKEQSLFPYEKGLKGVNLEEVELILSNLYTYARTAPSIEEKKLFHSIDFMAHYLFKKIKFTLSKVSFYDQIFEEERNLKISEFANAISELYRLKILSISKNQGLEIGITPFSKVTKSIYEKMRSSRWRRFLSTNYLADHNFYPQPLTGSYPFFLKEAAKFLENSTDIQLQRYFGNAFPNTTNDKHSYLQAILNLKTSLLSNDDFLEFFQNNELIRERLNMGELYPFNLVGHLHKILLHNEISCYLETLSLPQRPLKSPVRQRSHI